MNALGRLKSLEFTVKLLRGIQKQWLEQAEKHRDARHAALARLTREHHEREEQYYNGKADGIRQSLEMIADARILTGPMTESDPVIECAGRNCLERQPLSQMEVLDHRPFCRKCADEVFAELKADAEAIRQEEANLR